MDPRDIEVNKDGAENGRRDAVFVPIRADWPIVSLEPSTESVEQEGAIPPWGASVARRSDGMRRYLSRNHALFKVLLETRKQAPVGSGDPFRCQHGRLSSGDALEDLIDGPQCWDPESG